MPITVLFIVAIPFAFAAWVVDRVLQHRAQLKGLAAPPAMPALPPNAEIEQRLANLEAIVCSADYDVASRMTQQGPHQAA